MTQPKPAGMLASLRRFAKPAGRETTSEVCDGCGAALGREHAHLFHVERRTLQCACAACTAFPAPKTKHIRSHFEHLGALQVPEALWAALAVPVGLVFFYASSATSRVHAAYPGAAGAVEAFVDAEAWQSLLRGFPLLVDFEEDVEALLVHRLAGAREAYRVSIDECFRLVAITRAAFHGPSPQDAAEAAVQAFFERLRPSPSSRSRPHG